MTTFFFRRIRCAPAALLLLVGGCTLTSREIEPALLDGRLNDNDTIACYIDQKSVAASNYADLNSILVTILGGDKRPVVGKLDASGTLYVRGGFEGYQQIGMNDRVVRLALPAFKGVGTYSLTSPGTYYQEYTPPATTQGTGSTLTYSLVPSAPAQVIISGWDVTTRHLQGTFTLAVIAPGAAKNVLITDGRFDLIVDN